ncbi:MAG: hypothetical protein R3B45_09245 [Bdellovibrionota bacterium]
MIDRFKLTWILTLLVFFLLMLISSNNPLKAEPWLGTRFAQNCAGCHAPQRLNTQPRDRRCTLSCQGCHVNPNGGGLRSFYGKWNGNHWLKSYRSSMLGHKKNFAPFKKQRYGKKPYKKGVVSESIIRNKGLPLVEQEAPMDESLYDRRYGRSKIIVTDRSEYLYSVPESDPWRQMGETKYNAGADARWFLSSTSTDSNGAKKKDDNKNFLMSVDFGLEYRPVYRKFHLVYENRFFGDPRSSGSTEKTLVLAQNNATRSLYALVDDLPWNIFVMGGYYRPLFGNQVPDHDALAQQMQSIIMSDSPFAQNLRYSAISIGTAPNVPYLNVHVIQKRLGKENDKTRGFGTNAGLRFVTLGGSLNYSYWRTRDDQGDEGITETVMHSIGFGMQIKRFTLFYEGISMTRDTPKDFREGGVHSVDTYTRVWRELYLLANYSVANTSVSVTSGVARQYKTGVRTFLYPGVDLSLLYASTLNDDYLADSKIERSGITGQVHMYF